MYYNDNNDYSIYNKNDYDLSVSRFDGRRDYDYDRRRGFDYDRRRDFDYDYDRRQGVPLWFFFWPFFFR